MKQTVRCSLNLGCGSEIGLWSWTCFLAVPPYGSGPPPPLDLRTSAGMLCGHRLLLPCSTFLNTSNGIFKYLAWEIGKFIVRKHLTGGFLCAVLDLSGILWSLLIPEYSGIQRRGMHAFPGAEESRHFSLQC